MTSEPTITDASARAEQPLRSRFLDAGMRVLARDGYVGFKQATVCAETGLTTGAFYHSFRNWKEYERALIEHWRVEATDRIVARLDTEPPSAERIAALIEVALSLPHRSEAAIRAWAAVDERVADALADVDAVRRGAVARYIGELGVDQKHADHLAGMSMLLLIGHETAGTPITGLEWSMRHVIETDPQIQAAFAALDQTPE